MTRLNALISLFVVLLAAAESKQTTGDLGQTGAIHALIDRCVHALNAKDVDEFGAVFAENGEFTNPVGMTAKGRAAIEQFHAALFRENNRPSFAHAHLTLLGSTIRMIRPDVAAVDVRWEQNGAIDPTG